jgi:hypothetical protein
MERAYGARGRAFDAELRTLPALRFLFTSPKTGRLLNGIIRSSADQVGRIYPFMVGFALPSPSPGPAFDRLPLLARPVMQALLDTTTGDLSGTTLPQFLERLQTLVYAAEDNAAEQALRTYLFSTTLDALLADWPGTSPAEQRHQCLLEYRQVSQPPFPPRYLTTGPTHGEPGEVSFWLTLLRQWLPVRANPVLVAWPATPGTNGPFRLLFDGLHGRYFEPLFWPDGASNLTLDLAKAPGPRHSPTPPTDCFSGLRPRALLQDVILCASRV